MRRTRRAWYVDVLLLVAVIALFAVPLALRLNVGDDPSAQPYQGTDSAAAGIVESRGYRPWFSPLFAPSSQVESGLFALQAALGAGGLGFALGRLSARRGMPRPDPPAED